MSYAVIWARRVHGRCAHEGVVIGTVIPIPAPLRKGSDHVEKPIAVRREKTIWKEAEVIDEGCLVKRVRSDRTQIIGNPAHARVESVGMGDCVPPWKPPAFHPAARCLFPFRLGGKPVAVGSPVPEWSRAKPILWKGRKSPSTIGLRVKWVDVVTWLETLHFGTCVAKLHCAIPSRPDGLCSRTPPLART